MTEITFRFDRDMSYPTPAESEASAIERGFAAEWYLRLRVVDGERTEFRGPYSEDFVLQHAEDEQASGRWSLIEVQECSAYMVEQVAAERAFEARVG